MLGKSSIRSFLCRIEANGRAVCSQNNWFSKCLKLYRKRTAVDVSEAAPSRSQDGRVFGRWLVLKTESKASVVCGGQSSADKSGSPGERESGEGAMMDCEGREMRQGRLLIVS